MKRLLLPIVAVLGLALAAIAGAHVFTASPSLSLGKVPSGTTSAGARIIVFGKVHSRRAFCREDRIVRLFLVRSGPDRLLATDRTDREGEYSFQRRPGRDQRVYTRVGSLFANPYGHSHRCRADRSRNLRINVT